MTDAPQLSDAAASADLSPVHIAFTPGSEYEPATWSVCDVTSGDAPVTFEVHPGRFKGDVLKDAKEYAHNTYGLNPDAWGKVRGIKDVVFPAEVVNWHKGRTLAASLTGTAGLDIAAPAVGAAIDWDQVFTGGQVPRQVIATVLRTLHDHAGQAGLPAAATSKVRSWLSACADPAFSQPRQGHKEAIVMQSPTSRERDTAELRERFATQEATRQGAIEEIMSMLDEDER